MLLSILALVFGLIGLVFSADKISSEGAMLGTALRVSPIVIGLLVFGFGSSAPEIVVSISAALSDNNYIALGNAFGSNIFNILLVLAISAIIFTVPFENNNLKKEYIYLIFVTLVLGILLYDNYLGFIDGVVLIVIFALFLYIVIKTAKHHLILEQEIKVDKSNSKILFLLFINLAVLIISARILVFGGQELAKILGVSDLIIGLTIISLGTSLPELSLAIASSIKRQHQMLIGNILGSNIFNSTIVVGMVALINPDFTKVELFNRDYLFIVIATLLIIILAFKINKKHQINRISGFIMLAVLIIYLTQLV